MGWESFDVNRFDLWPFFQGQMRIAKIKGAYNSLIVPRGHINLQGQTKRAKLKSAYNSLIIGRAGLGW